MSEESTLLEAVAEVARLAGRVALEHFGRNVAVDTKSDGSPVTIADRSAESAAVDWIERRFPGDGVLGEEFGTRAGHGRRRWIIDPIDGTRSFVKGVPLWGTLIAIADDTGVLAGAASFPALGELLNAARGEGCWWNGSRARVSIVSRVEDATVLTTDEQFKHAPPRRDGWNRLARAARMSRTWGDCYGYLLVATGRAEVMVDGVMSEWDSAALLPAITEAGGVFTDWSGRPVANGGSAIATNAALALEARVLLGAGMPEGAA